MNTRQAYEIIVGAAHAYSELISADSDVSAEERDERRVLDEALAHIIAEPTISVPVPFLVTVYQTLAAMEAVFEKGEILKLPPCEGHTPEEGLGLLVSGLNSALLDHNVHPDVG